MPQAQSQSAWSQAVPVLPAATDAPRKLRSQIVIPARLASTRLPHKLLLNATGKSVLQHTYEQALQSNRALGVIVAADCDQIVNEVESFGGTARVTRDDHQSGTDRVAEVAAALPDADIIVNVQGDEPELSPQAIDLVIELLEQSPAAVMSTLAAPIRTPEQYRDPACVKVVRAADGRALYFSRAPIPHAREGIDQLFTDPPAVLGHIGMYAYRREFLLQLSQLPPSPLEKLEKLEQLRVLEAGHTILVGLVDEAARGIDTPEDYRAFVERQAGR